MTHHTIWFFLKLSSFFKIWPVKKAEDDESDNSWKTLLQLLVGKATDLVYLSP